jgi:hypothetical protein
MRAFGILTLAFALAGGVTPARADLIFDFSFSNTTGNVAGTVTGEILGLTDNTALEAATDIVITSYPDAVCQPRLSVSWPMRPASPNPSPPTFSR